jgi:hypothetical protein
MTPEVYLYSRIGMALVSAQRVEFIAGELLQHLTEFDSTVYGISSAEFLSNSDKAKKSRKTLGAIFKLLNLSPTGSIEEELNQYVQMRNDLVHHFWKEQLQKKSNEQMTSATTFLQEFGNRSEELEQYFKGFVYFLALRHVIDVSELDPKFKEWKDEFKFFLRKSVTPIN